MPESFRPDPESQQPGSQEVGRDVFLLGGQDLEMDRIKGVLKRNEIPYIDKDLDWKDASIDQYLDDIQQILDRGDTPVAIELRDADKIEGVVDIDHHNEKSDRPPSLLQVSERIRPDKPRGLVHRLVAANDAGYIPAMESVAAEELERRTQMGRDPEKTEAFLKKMIEAVRRKDREKQGVTIEMEEEAVDAIEKAERLPDGSVIVRLNGDKPSPVTDRLYGEKHQKLVVVCNSDKEEKEVWFFGDGEVCRTTRDHFVALKDSEIQQGTRVGNEHHAWGGGAGYGKKGENAQIGVVARNPEEVIKYIVETQE